MELGLLEGNYTIARYARDSHPSITQNQSLSLLSVSWTETECTVVSIESEIPPGYEELSEGWSVLKIEGILDFSLVGVLSSVLAPLGQAGVRVFTMSTFSTDYILVQKESLDSAVASLRSAGFVVGLL
jgi:uncharacterized protein